MSRSGAPTILTLNSREVFETASKWQIGGTGYCFHSRNRKRTEQNPPSEAVKVFALRVARLL